MNPQLFDIKSYLEDRGIRIFTEGKNTSPGWININCPWCGDKSNHLGINLWSKKMHCWKCKPKGSVINLVMLLDGIPFSIAEKVMFQYEDLYFYQHIPKEKEKVKFQLPKEASSTFANNFINYLIGRGFDPKEIIPKYQLISGTHLGDYKFRIIIPVIMYGRMIGFTSRDITGKAELRYKECPKEMAIIPPEQWLYNLDTVGEAIAFVEGPFDVMRCGNGFVSNLGTSFSLSFVSILKNRGVKRAFTIFDPEKEATKQSIKLRNLLSTVIPHVENINLNEGDPAELSDQDVKVLRRMIF